MSDELLSERDLAFVDAVAERVLELLEERDAANGRSRLVSAGELAKLIGRSREWIYANADELGVRRIGKGDRPRLLFDVDRALSGRRTNESSQLADPPAGPGASRHRRRRGPGSEAELLPIGGRRTNQPPIRS